MNLSVCWPTWNEPKVQQPGITRRVRLPSFLNKLCVLPTERTDASFLAVTQTDNSIHFKLSIWRPALLEREYIHLSPDEENPNKISTLEPSDVLEQIYFWNAGPHDLFSSVSREAGRVFQEELTDPFSLGQDLDKRAVDRFNETVSRLICNPLFDSRDHWTESQESISVHSEEDLNLRANIIRALLLHLQWVAHTFRHTPQASVLIR